VTYLRWLTDAGLELRSACAQLAFSVAVGSDFFMEIAKLRALRQCWSNLVRACGGDADEQRCVIHATTSARTKTRRDPWVNMLRETTEAFAAAAGGADAITTEGFDRLLGISDPFGRRIAGNAQVILNEEAHVTRVADPAGGAYYVEALTDHLAQQAWALFQTIEAEGGMLAALTSGKIVAQVVETAHARAALIARRKQAITGVSEFAKVDEERVARAEPDWDAITAARTAALARLSQDEAIAKPLLQARGGGADLVAIAIDVASKGASLERLSRALCAATGDGEPARIEPLPLRRDAEPFERLRDACDERERASGKRPSVFLCNIGSIPEHQARAQFAAGFFNAGGLAVTSNDGFSEPQAAADAFARSGAEVAAICGADVAYPDWIERLASLLRAGGATRVIVAGRPGEAEARQRAAGVTDFIYMGCNAVETLQRLLAALGVEP
jgi:methylmalonyl-CoA mutase